jgi:hypothetical protein
LGFSYLLEQGMLGNNFMVAQKVVLLLGLGIILQGCAFGTRHAVLQYPPPMESGDVQASIAQTQPIALSATVKPFTDRRTEPVVGHVRNGWGIKTADVVGVGDVPTWVKGSIETELRGRGVEVFEANSGSKPGLLTVTGQVAKAYCSMYATYEAEVLLNVLVNDSSGRELLSRTYTGTGSAGMVWSASAESFATSLSLALQQAAKAFASDFAQIRPVR